MTLKRLILQSLWYRRVSVMGLVLAMAAAAAGVTGGLVVGDSLRASLKSVLLARLQGVELAASPRTPFRAQLAEELAKALPQARVEAILSLDGWVQKSESSPPVSGFAFLGVPAQMPLRFLAARTGGLTPHEAGLPQRLATELGIHDGDDILVGVPQWGESAGDSLFSQRRTDRLVRSVRRTARIVADEGMATFSLRPTQASPRNILLERGSLGELAGAPGSANLLLLTPQPGSSLDAQRAGVALSSVVRMEDVGLHLSPAGEEAAPATSAYALRPACLHSASFLLSRKTVDAIQTASARQLGKPGEESSVYIADRIVAPASGTKTSYAVIAALPQQGLQPDEIAITSWLMDDLGTRPNDAVRLEYLLPRGDGGFDQRSVDLRVRQLPDPPEAPDLMPPLPGITDADRIDAWEAPFPVDLSRVTPRDEAYWKEHKATPKAFVSPALLQRIWQEAQGGNGDWVTGMRVMLPESGLAVFEKQVVAELQARGEGLALRPVREEATAASEGSSDFGALFAGMSLFLVVAAGGIALTLARLGMESRGKELGVLIACGFSRGKLIALLAGELTATVVLSAAAGMGLAVTYAQGLLLIFTRQREMPWELPPLALEIKAATLAIAAACCISIGLLAFVQAWRVLTRLAPVQLLRAGGETPVSTPRVPGGSGKLWIALLVASLAAMLLPRWVKGVSPGAAFLPSAALLLVALLLWQRRLILRAAAPRARLTQTSLVAASLAARRRSSTLTLGLFAIAAFMLVSVAMQRTGDGGRDEHEKASATGGFRLKVTCAVAPGYELAAPSGRERLGFSAPDSAELEGVTMVPLWSEGKGNVSCLNLARSSGAKVLGVNDSLMRSGRFELHTQPSGIGWEALRPASEDPATPIIGDTESMQWILKRSLGEVFALARDDGSSIKVRLAGTVEGGLFAGEVLMDKAAMEKQFPSLGRPTMFLLDVPPPREQAVREALLRGLAAFGPQIESVPESIARVLSVQRLYMTFFLMLGAAGLLLGALGQGAVMIRHGFERRNEMMVLLAEGFSRRRVQVLLAAEQGVLLLGGVTIGAVSALAPGLVLMGAASVRGVVLVLLLIVAAGAAAIALPLWFTVPGEQNLRLQTE